MSSPLSCFYSKFDFPINFGALERGAWREAVGCNLQGNISRENKRKIELVKVEGASLAALGYARA